MNAHENNGYKDRVEYLESLVDEYCVDSDVVFILAELLGEEEDFDGLISALEDANIYFGGIQ